MRRTTEQVIDSNTLTTNTAGLMKLLCCGRCTAEKIGIAAGARIQYGKRVLWFLPNIYVFLKNSTDIKTREGNINR